MYKIWGFVKKNGYSKCVNKFDGDGAPIPFNSLESLLELQKSGEVVANRFDWAFIQLAGGVVKLYYKGFGFTTTDWTSDDKFSGNYQNIETTISRDYRYIKNIVSSTDASNPFLKDTDYTAEDFFKRHYPNYEWKELRWLPVIKTDNGYRCYLTEKKWDVKLLKVEQLDFVEEISEDISTNKFKNVALPRYYNLSSCGIFSTQNADGSCFSYEFEFNPWYTVWWIYLKAMRELDLNVLFNIKEFPRYTNLGRNASYATPVNVCMETTWLKALNSDKQILMRKLLNNLYGVLFGENFNQTKTLIVNYFTQNPYIESGYQINIDASKFIQPTPTSNYSLVWSILYLEKAQNVFSNHFKELEFTYANVEASIVASNNIYTAGFSVNLDFNVCPWLWATGDRKDKLFIKSMDDDSVVLTSDVFTIDYYTTCDYYKIQPFIKPNIYYPSAINNWMSSPLFFSNTTRNSPIHSGSRYDWYPKTDSDGAFLTNTMLALPTDPLFISGCSFYVENESVETMPIQNLNGKYKYVVISLSAISNYFKQPTSGATPQRPGFYVFPKYGKPTLLDSANQVLIIPLESYIKISYDTRTIENKFLPLLTDIALRIPTGSTQTTITGLDASVIQYIFESKYSPYELSMLTGMRQESNSSLFNGHWVNDGNYHHFTNLQTICVDIGNSNVADWFKIPLCVLTDNSGLEVILATPNYLKYDILKRLDTYIKSDFTKYTIDTEPSNLAPNSIYLENVDSKSSKAFFAINGLDTTKWENTNWGIGMIMNFSQSQPIYRLDFETIRSKTHLGNPEINTFFQDKKVFPWSLIKAYNDIKNNSVIESTSIETRQQQWGFEEEWFKKDQVFAKDVQNLKQTGMSFSTIGNTLGGVGQGAMAGMKVGGPIGAGIGAIMGGFTSAINGIAEQVTDDQIFKKSQAYERENFNAGIALEKDVFAKTKSAQNYSLLNGGINRIVPEELVWATYNNTVKSSNSDLTELRTCSIIDLERRKLFEEARNWGRGYRHWAKFNTFDCFTVCNMLALAEDQNPWDAMKKTIRSYLEDNLKDDWKFTELMTSDISISAFLGKLTKGLRLWEEEDFSLIENKHEKEIDIVFLQNKDLLLPTDANLKGRANVVRSKVYPQMWWKQRKANPGIKITYSDFYITVVKTDGAYKYSLTINYTKPSDLVVAGSVSSHEFVSMVDAGYVFLERMDAEHPIDSMVSITGGSAGSTSGTIKIEYSGNSLRTGFLNYIDSKKDVYEIPYGGSSSPEYKIRAYYQFQVTINGENTQYIDIPLYIDLAALYQSN